MWCLQQLLNNHLAHFLLVEPLLTDSLLVQHQTVVQTVFDDILSQVQSLLQALSSLSTIHLVEHKRTSAQTVVFHELKVMRSAMVGSQEYQVVTLAHLLVESLQQFGNVLIQFQISLVGMLATGAVLMSDHICLREADTQHIRLFALTKLFAF